MGLPEWMVVMLVTGEGVFMRYAEVETSVEKCKDWFEF